MDIGYQQPRELIPPDLQLVSDAAAILHLREFDLFHAAWQSWFGHALDDKTVERLFVTYMFHQRVPHWMRHFARRVIHEGKTGNINLLGGADYTRQAPLPDSGEGYITTIYVAAVIILVILSA